MTVEEALLTLGNSTGEVVLGVLSMLCGDGAEKGPASMVASGAAPLEAIAYPAVAANVSYVDGVTGGNVFTMSRLGARRLAAAMMMQELPTEDSGSELDELELWLDLPDPDIFSWITGEVATPAQFDTPLFARLVASPRDALNRGQTLS